MMNALEGCHLCALILLSTLARRSADIPRWLEYHQSRIQTRKKSGLSKIKQKYNEIADQNFRFTPPPGVEVVEGDFGQ